MSNSITRSLKNSDNKSIRKKVAIFSGFYLPFLGGIERYTNKLTKELEKLGYDVIIITTNHASLPSCEYGSPKVYRLPSYKLFKNRYPIIKKNRDFKNLMAQIEDEHMDYYVCNTRFQMTTLLGSKCAKANDNKAIIIEHGSSHFSVGNKILDWLGRLYEHCLTYHLKKDVSNYYGVSQKCNQWLGHFNIEASGVFYNSVDENAYRHFSKMKYKKSFDGKIVITYVGRIIREKGVEMLLKAFDKLSGRHGNTVLVIAGDGPLLSALREKNKNPRVFFEGKLSYEDTMSLLNVTDIFCNPSMYPEGLPTSILEAGVMKSAVIATDRGGTKEVIISPEYGIIIEESVDSLENALEELINNPSRLSLLKNSIHNRIINNFTWKLTAHKVSQVLKELR